MIVNASVKVFLVKNMFNYKLQDPLSAVTMEAGIRAI